jgi:hypothetical protein
VPAAGVEQPLRRLEVLRVIELAGNPIETVRSNWPIQSAVDPVDRGDLVDVPQSLLVSICAIIRRLSLACCILVGIRRP